MEAVITKLVDELKNAPASADEKAFKDMVPSAKEEVLFRRAIVELAQ